MKLRFFIILSIFTIALVSCNLDSESNFTPQMSIWASHVNKTDTIKIRYTEVGGIIKMDTINVGDTILLRLYLDALTNHLANFQIALSDTSASKLVLPAVSLLDSVFSKSQSNYSTRSFAFHDNESSFFFPIHYVAKKSTSDAYVQFTLTSDANFKLSEGTNITSFKLVIPAKVKVVQ